MLAISYIVVVVALWAGHWCSNQVFSPAETGACGDMLHSYFPIYKIALDLQALRNTAEVYKGSQQAVSSTYVGLFYDLLMTIQQRCSDYNLAFTSSFAKRLRERGAPETYRDLLNQIDHLNDSLSQELEKEAVFRVPPERIEYFEQDHLFGQKVAAAFPSCERDIRKAGSCYALGQEDACVHHLMLVLERGLTALATAVGVSYVPANWQAIINQVESHLKSLPKGTKLDFYRQVNAQFGFLKEAYRNHSAHMRDDPYDLEKALSILNHVRAFMKELEKGGLAE